MFDENCHLTFACQHTNTISCMLMSHPTYQHNVVVDDDDVVAIGGVVLVVAAGVVAVAVFAAAPFSYLCGSCCCSLAPTLS